MVSISEVLKSIYQSDKNTYVIIYSPWCRYSMSALSLLKTLKLDNKSIIIKSYNIEDINMDFEKVKEILGNDNKIRNNQYHSTRPIVYNNNTYIGGYNDLVEYLKRIRG